MTKAKATTRATYIVANPRGLPAGTWIIRVDDRRWFEGDVYDGPVTERFVRDRFIVPVESVQKEAPDA